MDYCFILGVFPGSDLKTCEEAYRKLVLTHHPDRGGKTEDMIRINGAIEEARKCAARQNKPEPNDIWQKYSGYRQNGFNFGDFTFVYEPNDNDIASEYVIEAKIRSAKARFEIAKKEYEKAAKELNDLIILKKGQH
jgi:curved DNA-binding protein CbpA